MNNLSDFANFGELEILWGSGSGAPRKGVPGGGAQNGSLHPGRQKPSLRPCSFVLISLPHSTLLIIRFCYHVSKTGSVSRIPVCHGFLRIIIFVL